MGDEDKPDSGVRANVDVAARAEAKFEVKTEVPSETSGRLVDALTDVIRPFTERRGLRADILRLQREDVLIEIAKKAAKRAQVESLNLNPVPNKFMVPFLERSSTEDVESELTDRWADLLLSASQSYEARFILYTNILSMLGSQDVKFIEGMIKTSRYRPTQGGHAHYQDAPFNMSFDELISDIQGVCDRDGMADPEAVARVVAANEKPGIYIRIVEFQNKDDKSESVSKTGDGFPHVERHSLSTLKSLGLVNHHVYSDGIIIVDVVVLTELGVDFFEACNRSLEAN